MQHKIYQWIRCWNLKGKAHWHLCPWVLGVELKKMVQKRSHGETGSQRSDIEMEEVREVVGRIRNVANNSASYQSSPSLPLLHWLSCFRREDAEKSSSVNKVTDFWKHHTKLLFAMVNDRYTLINVIRMTMKGSLVTFQRCCFDVSKSTWNNHQKESTQHRTYRGYLWRFAAGQDWRGDLHHTFHLGNKRWQRQDYWCHFAHEKKNNREA